MGCDIHAVIERRGKLGDGYEWLDSGDPDIGRNYEMFAVLAGVRNYEEITPIAEPRGLPGFKEWHEADGTFDGWASWDRDISPSYEYQSRYERWYHDAHSASWLTLAEIKAFDHTQEVDDGQVIVGRNPEGGVAMTARWSSTSTEKVGRRRILTWPGEAEPRSWFRLIRYMEQAKWDGQSDDEIRLVFFFDN